MRPIYAAAALTLAFALPASAALAPGTRAPDFSTQGAINGVVQNFRLSTLLRQGPVVLYFFPAANTAGCNAEAHAFAEALNDFKAAGATVIGMSTNDIATLRTFSVEHCAGKFPVATASQDTVRNYDVALNGNHAITSRTSYVIAPNGRVVYSFSEMRYGDHVKNTLAAVREYQASRRRR